MTFHSSRNAAQTHLSEAAKASGPRRDEIIGLAQANIALAQAEAFHELATGMNNLAVAIARWQR